MNDYNCTSGDGELAELYAGIGTLLSIAADAIIAIDANHRITLFNEGAERIFGYSKAEILGQPLSRLIPDRFRPSHTHHISNLQLGQKASRLMGERQEVYGLRKDGTEFPAEASIAMVAGAGKKSFLAVLRDITERKRTQEILAGHARELELRVRERTSELEAEIARREEAQAQLIQSQRMEAFGQLTGGVAHDFNNLLTIITGNLELLMPELATPKAQRHAKRALEACEMASRLTSRLLTFARRRRLEPRIVDLNELVLGMTEIVHRTIGAHISLSTILMPELWLTRADPSEIENAVLNLVINARDAMPRGGRIVVETRNATFGEADHRYVSGIPKGRFVVVSVTDTGVGMPPEIVARAFEPFFTTKPTGRGTGLGLSTIYGFAQQTGGHVTLYSEVGKGTTVSIYLPRAVDLTVTDEGRVQDDEIAFSRNSEMVLVVEDNPDVREVTLQRIEGLGYVVLEAANAPEAIRILDENPDVQLVLTDVVMPGGMSGFELAHWIGENKPNVAVVCTSGFAEGASGQQGLGSAPACAMLHKPYGRAELSKVLDAALVAKESAM
ncbi:MAG TPA: PAS domain S-box protein [Hyphomicrobium sp.]|nr:PAS domain S-box protein [Hyphomicrobium sp.]